MPYISITGLKPKGLFSFFRFWRLAIPSFEQARKAKGNLHCEVKRVQGFQCTLTAWESREDMLNFMRAGAHLKAMKAFHQIATGKTFGYESERIPTWTEAFSILQEKGKNY
jgi:heme-degrading monooxygenase HmoA